jgi:hypothetical protein
MSPDDLATWQANFGLGATTPTTTAVPEPGTFALVGLAFARLLLSEKRGHFLDTFSRAKLPRATLDLR